MGTFEEIYDEKFGMPNTNVYNADCFFEYLLDVMDFNGNDSDTIVDEVYSAKYTGSGKISKIVVTKVFELSVKDLKKNNKTKVLRNLYDTVFKLANYEIETQKDNHSLADFQGLCDIHSDDVRLVLPYRYIDDEVLIVSLRSQQEINE